MTVVEFFNHLTRVAFMGITLITAAGYLEHRDSTRRDIFFVFFSLSSGFWFQLVEDLTGVTLPWRGQLTQYLLVAQPYLMVRLVRYFRHVDPRWVNLSLATCIVSILLLIFVGLTSLPVLILVIGNFVVFDGYAVLAFFSGAFNTAGVVRQRLRFAAAGSAFLVAILLITGVNIVLPDARPFTMPLIQLLAIMCAIAFYLGFAPPRWLRRSWQHAVLRQYLQQVQFIGDQTLAGVIDQLKSYVKRAIGSNVGVVEVALRDRDGDRLLSQQPAAPDVGGLPMGRILEDVHKQESGLTVLRTNARETGIETVLAVPISARNERLGVLAVGLQHGSIFVDEDLSLLRDFAQQAGIVLQNQALFTALAERNVDLEQKVAARTVDLQRSNEELKMFAYVASHDLQEPLRTISSYLQLIEKRYGEKLDGEGREFFEFAIDGAARMKELIQDVLAYSRVETQPNNFTTFNAQEVVDDVCRLLETAINEAQAIITCDALPDVTADRRLMVQLFQNLLSNAVKYRADRKPEIHVCAERDTDYWRFSIRDNGIGIEPQFADQIFVVFRRLHHRGTYQGTGIGLAICKKAVELHGGRIWTESTPGVGSTFYFTLPVSPAVA